jgi:adenylate kinase
MKLLLLGAPASGKGTFGKILSQKLSLPLISSGVILRDLDQSHPRYEEVHKTMLEGGLVDQQLLRELLIERTNQPDCANGFILEGWGRKMIDIELFNPGFDHVIHYVISKELAYKRITGRRSCPEDGSVYNIHTNPPKVEGKCDLCGADLVQRADDNEETLNTRYGLFETETTKVVEFFKNQGNLIEISGDGVPEEIVDVTLSLLPHDQH